MNYNSESSTPLPHRRRPVVVNLQDRARFPWMQGIVLAVPGIIFEHEASGIRVRILPDGSLEEITAGRSLRAP